MSRPSRRRTRPPLRIALTGGAASGKTTVATLFAALGVPVIDTDQVARDVVAPGTPLLAQVLARFGPDVAGPDGALDRRALRRVILADPRARADLESLLHPAIRARVAALSAGAGGDYQLIAVPLLVETGTAGDYDRVLVVDCDPGLQQLRVMHRDNVDAVQAAALLAAQASREQRLSVADDVIHNTGDIAALAPQVEALHRRYLGLADEGLAQG